MSAYVGDGNGVAERPDGDGNGVELVDAPEMANNDGSTSSRSVVSQSSDGSSSSKISICEGMCKRCIQETKPARPRRWRRPILRTGLRRNRARIAVRKKPTCDQTSSLDSLEELCCLYITSEEQPQAVTAARLEEVLRPLVPQCKVRQTACGLIVVFPTKEELERVLQMDLKAVFGAPVQVGNLSTYDRRYRAHVIFKGIPWCISTPELAEALTQQGIRYGELARLRSTLRVEVFNSCHLDRLLREGLNFYNCKSFGASVADGGSEQLPGGTDIVQCFHCQGFWHTAAHCRHTGRCVRCGENHPVEMCTRPKSEAVCCNCGGPHHAAFKQCPIKLQLLHSTRIAFSLTSQPQFMPPLN